MDLLESVNTNSLSHVGSFFAIDPKTRMTIRYAAIDELVAATYPKLSKTPARCLIVTGRASVGKTTFINLLAEKHLENHGSVWTATPSHLMAGQSYIGQIEQRLSDVIKELKSRSNTIWYMPSMQDATHIGKFSGSPVGIIDHLYSALERGEIQIVGEVEERALEILLEAHPRLVGMCDVVTVAEPRHNQVFDIARRWADKRSIDGKRIEISDEAVREAIDLSGQFYSMLANPGATITFLERVIAGGDYGQQPRPKVDVDDLYDALSKHTGVPRFIVSDREHLDIEEARKFFESRVIGQPEAVQCLVDRVALIKSGLLDPSKPWGVFLFLGPTGTGKTELSKALAEYLYGSQERLIRVDMSEILTYEDLDRLTGESNSLRSSQSLLTKIRRSPFSVVLLDEFEKADSRSWDFFLQVFDDGRLSDKTGKVGDFRSSILIMTANLGFGSKPKPSVGFGAKAAESPDRILERTLENTFRPEFLNRIDRIVQFRPLTRTAMRRILVKELEAALDRRGIRRREWSIEWEPSAVEFLLDRGFSPTMGARPLKRAIEQYLLTPLAHTIVEHRYPEGEQFLFVRRRDQRLEAYFVDPSAPAIPVKSPAEAPEGASPDVGLKKIIRKPIGARQELDELQGRIEQMQARFNSAAWREEKDAGMARMAESGFWESDERFETLGWIEYRDRIEAAFDAARSLIERLAGISGAGAGGQVKQVLSSLAQQIYLLEEGLNVLEGRKPIEVFLIVTTSRRQKQPQSEIVNFHRQLCGMYATWAKSRRMAMVELDASAVGSDMESYRNAWAVSGLGVVNILLSEDGIHLRESGSKRDAVRRIRSRVRVLPQPNNASGEPQQILEQAVRENSANLGSHPNKVLRRYVIEPSPLVVDSGQGWKTGRLDDVLSGNFDLYR